MPDDFAETFARVGWEGILDAYQAHRTTVTRWIEDYDLKAIRENRPVLNVLRRRWLEERYGAEGKRVGGRRPGMSRAARYVLGLRFKKTRTPTFFDAELMEEEK